MRQVTKLVKRAPEEELMDLPAHAQAYANADFSEPNSKFVALFSEKFPGFNGQQIIDLGFGPADILLVRSTIKMDTLASKLASQFAQLESRPSCVRSESINSTSMRMAS